MRGGGALGPAGLLAAELRLGQAAALFAIGCAAQLHPQAAALLVVWLAVALAKRRVGWPSGVALLGLGLVLAPYLYLQVGSGWSDVGAAWRYLLQPKVLDAQAFRAVGELFSSAPYGELLAARGAPTGVSLADPLLWLLAVGLLAGLALTFGRRRTSELVVAGCFLAPLLAALDHSGDVEPHYLLVLLPSGCVLLGLALQPLLGGSPGKAAAEWPAWLEPNGDGAGSVPADTAAPSAAEQARWRPWLGGALLVALLAVAGFDWVSFQAATPEVIGANYGVPLRYSMEAAQRAGAAPGPLLVSNLDADAGVFAYLTGDQKRFDGRYTLVLPQGGGTYLADASLPFAYRRLSAAGPPLARFTTPAGRAVYGLFPAGGERLPAGLQPLDVDVGHALQLVGLAVPELRGGAPSTALLAWRVTDAHAAIPDDLRQFGHLVDASGKLWSSNPDFRGYPRPYWQTGDVVLSAFQLDLPASIPSGGYWLETGFYEPISGQRLAQFRGGQPAGTSARIGPLKVAGVSPPADDARPLGTFGGGQIALLGVQRTAGGVSLRWRALAAPRADYTVFVHVLDAAGKLLAQQDGPPRDGSYPTSLWSAGEVVDDPHALALPAQPGLRLEIGLYTYPDLRRLPLDGGGDSLVLPAPTS